MYKAIHHDGYKSLVDVSEYLARHDIVYRRPALKPYEGLPVGDGKMGGLLYHEPNGIAMQVNHTDRFCTGWKYAGVELGNRGAQYCSCSLRGYFHPEFAAVFRLGISAGL